MQKKLGKSATEITVEFVIDKPLEDVWKNFSDVAGIYLNSPTVDSSYYVSDTKRGVGAIRHMLMAKSIVTCPR